MNPAAKQALDLAKKNILSIAFVVGGIVAIGACFIYPIPQMYQSFNQETAAAASKYAEINTLVNFKPNKPAIFNPDGEPLPLESFPTSNVIEAYEKSKARFLDEAKNLVLTVLSTGAQAPLEKDLFPLPPRGQEVTAFRQFQEAYTRKYRLDPRLPNQSFVTEILNGVQPPTQNEIAEIGRRVTAEIRRNRSERDANNRVVNQPEVDAAIQEELAKILPRERTSRATNAKVFVSPDAFRPLPAYLQAIGLATGNAGTNTTGGGVVNAQTNIVPVFNAQVGLWIHEAIARAVAQTNQAATNVFDAPIKHVVAVTWGEQLVPVRSPQTNVNMPGLPAEPMAEPTLPPIDFTSPLTPSYEQSPWGHASNNAYFAVPVKVTLRVDANRLPATLVALTKDNFLFVDNVNLRMVDTRTAKQQGFVYGPDTVVEVDLECTLLMLKNWIIPLMPPPVVQALAAAATPAAQQ